MEPIEFTAHKYKKINFQVTKLDTDYLGWKYKLPSNDSKLVVINFAGGYSSFSEEYVYTSPSFVISDWENLDTACYTYFVTVLVFSPDTKVKDLIFKTKKYLTYWLRKFPELKKIGNKIGKKYYFDKNTTAKINDRFYFDYKNKTIIKIKQDESIDLFSENLV